MDPRHWLPEEVRFWLTNTLRITSPTLVGLFRDVSGAKLYTNRRKADWFLDELGVKELLTRCRIAAAIQKLFDDQSSDEDTVCDGDGFGEQESNSRRTIAVSTSRHLDNPVVKRDPSDVQSGRKGLLALPAAVKAQPAASSQAAPRAMGVSNLEINPTRPSGEPSIMLPACLAAVIKPHQLTGIRFLWRTVVQEGRGAILAHAMGLGKTLQTVAFVHALLCEAAQEKAVKLPANYSSRLDYMPKILCYQRPVKILVLCPPIVISNWHAEYDMWIPESIRRSSRLHAIHRIRSPSSWAQKLGALRQWHEHGGIFVLGYQMYRQMLVRGPKALSASDLCLLKEMLVSPGPSVLIADEGHVIKNVNGTLAAVIKQTATPLRVCLTGYPLQNNLIEYWCMVDFVRPAFLDDLHRFRTDYVHPINRGSTMEATRGERKLAARRLFVLTRLLDPFVSRMDQGVLLDSLPDSIKKHEYVLSCRLSPLQRRLYDAFLDKRGRVFHEALFTKTVMLMRILNHPAILRIAANASAGWSEDDTGDEESFGLDGDADRAGNDQSEDANRIMDLKDWASAEMRLPGLMRLRHSPKMHLAIQLLRAFKRVGDKCLLFSRSIPTLDYICGAIEELNRRRSKQNAPIAYFRMDGMTHSAARLDMIARFNADQQDNVDVFLISTMTGSLGINLTRANRVILLDVGWNPCHDEQAIGRAFRFGQKRPVYVYRLQCYGTIDERLYRLNVHKAGMSKRVIDKQNIEKHFTRDQMTHYFATPSMPEDDPELKPLSMQIDSVSTDDAVLDRLLLETCTGMLDDDNDSDADAEEDMSDGRNLLGIARWFHHHSLLEESLVDELTTAEFKEAAEELERERLRLSSLSTTTGGNAGGKLGLLSGLRTATANPHGFWEDAVNEVEQSDQDDDDEEEERFYVPYSVHNPSFSQSKRSKQRVNPTTTPISFPTLPLSSPVLARRGNFTASAAVDSRGTALTKDSSQDNVTNQSVRVTRHFVKSVPNAVVLSSFSLPAAYNDKRDVLNAAPEGVVRISARKKVGLPNSINARGGAKDKETGNTEKLSIIDLLVRTPPKPVNLHPSMPVVSLVHLIQLTSAAFEVDDGGSRSAVKNANNSIGAQTSMKDGRNLEAPPPYIEGSGGYAKPHGSSIVTINSSSSDSEDCSFLATAVQS